METRLGTLGNARLDPTALSLNRFTYLIRKPRKLKCKTTGANKRGSNSYFYHAESSPRAQHDVAAVMNLAQLQ